MSDGTFWALVVLGCLIVWCVVTLAAVALCRAAAKPWPSEDFYAAYFAGDELPITGRDLYAQIAAAMAPDVIDEAEAIVKEAAA